MTEQKTSETQEKTTLDLTAQVEALLFVAPEPVSPQQMGTVLDVTSHQVKKCLDELGQHYVGRGIRLQWYDGKVQITSAPEAAQTIETFLNLEAMSTLSRAALEALSIIVYQQPITRPQIDAIRGVNSDGVIRGLLSKGLIEDVGRAEGPGRPILYSATAEFLKHFGLTSIEELPPLKLEEILAEAQENGNGNGSGPVLKE